MGATTSFRTVPTEMSEKTAIDVEKRNVQMSEHDCLKRLLCELNKQSNKYQFVERDDCCCKVQNTSDYEKKRRNMDDEHGKEGDFKSQKGDFKLQKGDFQTKSNEPSESGPFEQNNSSNESKVMFPVNRDMILGWTKEDIRDLFTHQTKACSDICTFSEEIKDYGKRNITMGVSSSGKINANVFAMIVDSEGIKTSLSDYDMKNILGKFNRHFEGTSVPALNDTGATTLMISNVKEPKFMFLILDFGHDLTAESTTYSLIQRLHQNDILDDLFDMYHTSSNIEPSGVAMKLVQEIGGYFEKLPITAAGKISNAAKYLACGITAELKKNKFNFVACDLTQQPRRIEWEEDVDRKPIKLSIGVNYGDITSNQHVPDTSNIQREKLNTNAA